MPASSLCGLHFSNGPITQNCYAIIPSFRSVVRGIGFGYIEAIIWNMKVARIVLLWTIQTPDGPIYIHTIQP